MRRIGRSSQLVVRNAHTRERAPTDDDTNDCYRHARCETAIRALMTFLREYGKVRMYVVSELCLNVAC